MVPRGGAGGDLGVPQFRFMRIIRDVQYDIFSTIASSLVSSFRCLGYTLTSIVRIRELGSN